MGLMDIFKRKKERVAGQSDLSQMPTTHQQAEQEQKKRLRNKVKEWRG